MGYLHLAAVKAAKSVLKTSGSTAPSPTITPPYSTSLSRLHPQIPNPQLSINRRSNLYWRLIFPQLSPSFLLFCVSAAALCAYRTASSITLSHLAHWLVQHERRGKLRFLFSIWTEDRGVGFPGNVATMFGEPACDRDNIRLPVGQPRLLYQVIFSSKTSPNCWDGQLRRGVPPPSRHPCRPVCFKLKACQTTRITWICY
jgi:hypothetical protein